MNELKARANLQMILDEKYKNDITFDETRYASGIGFVDAQIAKIYELGNGEWNDDIAISHIAMMKDKMLG